MKRPINPSELTPHPYASLFPTLGDDEIEELAADIRAHGLVAPILIFQDKVLDGRHRLQACLRAGVEPKFEFFKGKELEALSRVASTNLYRRHLPASQRAAIAAELVSMERALAGAEGVEGRGSTERSKKGARERAAKKTGVSPRSVREAEHVREEAPDVFEALMAGEVGSLPEARALAALEPDEREEALAMPKKERRLRLAQKPVEPPSDNSAVEAAGEAGSKMLAELDTLVGLGARLLHWPEPTRSEVQARLTEALEEARSRLDDLADHLSRASDAA